MKKIISALVLTAFFVSCSSSEEKVNSEVPNDSKSTSDVTGKTESSETQPTSESSDVINETNEMGSTESTSENIPEPNKVNNSSQEEKSDEVITQESDIDSKTTTDVIEETEIQVAEDIEEEIEINPVPDHMAFDALLKKYVDTKGDVNYKGLKKDRVKLEAYISILEKFQPASTWNYKEKLCYWINAYNAYTLKLIIDNYPLKSITDIGSPWKKRFIPLEGKNYNLDEIENKVIRPRFGEPRIHFAVNCASVSCPRLLNEAFTPAKLYGQLERNTKYFINNSAKNTLGSKSIQISQIFEWYGVDFEKSGGTLKFFQKYSKTEISDNAKMSYMEYNWSLNE